MRQRITQEDSGLTRAEWKALERLDTPQKIQTYLNGLDFDFGPGEDSDRSVRGILAGRRADCAGGAVLAAAALWAQGRKPLILDLKAASPDFDHVIAVFREESGYGAITKTNHAVLRYREPVYRNIRELVMSYFHEYFLPNGRKTLRSFSKPLDLSKYGYDWLTEKEELLDIIYDLDHAPHEDIAPKEAIKKFRKADPIEVTAGEITGA